MPAEPEPLGLLALMRLHRARARARFDDTGSLVLLERQDRSLWDRALIGDGCALVERAAALHHPGQYQLHRGSLLRRLGRPEAARTADQRALMLTANPAERRLLEDRIPFPEPDPRRPGGRHEDGGKR